MINKDPAIQTDIKEKIIIFFDLVNKDNNHRYKSWEHCYTYFNRGSGLDLDTACLHMAFYLASWGMYRGSSFLLWKDYLIHTEIIEDLLKKKWDVLRGEAFEEDIDNKIGLIFELIEKIKNWYPKNIKSVNGKKVNINVTDTLATKILLGSLGCIPAYDRFFIAGLRSKNLRYGHLNRDNFSEVVKFYNMHHNDFEEAGKCISKRSGSNITYPPMKLVDMYFWQLGYEIDRNKQ